VGLVFQEEEADVRSAFGDRRVAARRGTRQSGSSFGNGREDGKMTTSNWIDGLNHRENETVSECLELHDLTPAQEQEVRSAIQGRGRIRRFHELAAVC
jgi:hypothetical protein